jgi:predicted transcriptional regulator
MGLKPDAESEYEIIAARVDIDVRRKLIEIARYHDRSVSAEIRAAVTRYVADPPALMAADFKLAA